MTFIAPALGAATCTTLNALTPTALSTGFSIAGGTISRTLTVDETGSISAKAPLASPVFTTQITTPKIVTSSGTMEISPATNLGIKTSTPENTVDIAIPTGDGIRLGQIDTGAGTTVRYYGLNDLGAAGSFAGGCWHAIHGDNAGNYWHSWQTQLAGVGNKTMTLSADGHLTIPANLAVTGTMTAGTVPLARMMRTEVQGYNAAGLVTINLGTVNTGDRIMVTASGTNDAGADSLRVYQQGTGATVDFAGDSELSTYVPANIRGCIGGVCRVTATGTLSLTAYLSGGTAYIHAIVLNNG